MLPNYELISVARQSNLPQDAHLYMISAVQKKQGNMLSGQAGMKKFKI